MIARFAALRAAAADIANAHAARIPYTLKLDLTSLRPSI